jgi:tetratricopeptide (TPR) repeat protein
MTVNLESTMTRSAILFILALSTVSTVFAETLEDARAALGQQQFEQAATLFAEHLSSHPDDGAAHYQAGIALMSLDRLVDAERHFNRAADLGFQPMGVGYRLARLKARQGDQEAALSQLETIADGGFGLPALLEDEADFADLRSDPRFQVALAKVQAARYPCKASADHRAFDFWNGKWDVHYQGQQAGESEVYPILGDCVIFENWTSASGSTGKSFNYYDSSAGHWRQIWVDDRGGVIEFTGNFDGGMLKYEAETRDASGKTVLNRLNFNANPDGSVRQHWTQSSDGGQTWQEAFDGNYVRKPETD